MGLLEVKQRAPGDWHLRIDLNPYAEGLKETVPPVVPLYQQSTLDIIHCSIGGEQHCTVLFLQLLLGHCHMI